MALVTMDVRTYTQSAFPTDERLVVRFVPSGASLGTAYSFPLREVKVQVPSDGKVSVQLAPTVRLVPSTWYEIRFEWFDKHPLKDDWELRGWSDLPGRLHVPFEGGDVTDLLGDFTATPILIWMGFGPPPSWLPSGGVYYDLASDSGVDIYSEGQVV